MHSAGTDASTVLIGIGAEVKQLRLAFVKAKGRTVFIINAEYLDGFLYDFSVDDRVRHPSRW
jgi:hypothetical protein